MQHGGPGMPGPGGPQGRGGPVGPGRGGGPPGSGRGSGPPQDFGQGRGGPDMGRMDSRNAPRMETRDPRQAEPRRNPQQPGGMGGQQRLPVSFH